jgi:oligosaccharide reducing-end xylanase
MLAASFMRNWCRRLKSQRHLAWAPRCAALCLLVACGDSRGDTEAAAGGGLGSEATERAVEALGTTPEQLVEVLLSAEGASPTSGTENLLSERLGIPEQEVRQKLALAISRFFGIGTGEPNQLVADRGYRLYYELPQDRTQAFIWAPDSNDIRSEGMSYGMMIAVQAGLREHFDRLWNFARNQLQYSPEPAGPWSHYFKWQGTVDGSSAESWGVAYEDDTVPAPDGEEYFAASLYLAHRRWGSDGDVNYREAADAISQAMLDNPAREGRFPVIHRERDMVVFVPFERFYEFSDPSYHLPAFYELFALDGASGAERWRAIAETSRQFLVDSAHPETGLHPDYANFDGTPNAGGERHDEFRYDAWRVVMNMAMDYSWFSRDARMKAQVEKYHAFFSGHLGEGNVSSSLFALDGSGAEGGGSTALTATLAAGALASESEQRSTYLQNAWDVSQQSGFYRYYQECVYLLGLLGAAGQFGYEWGAREGAQ